MDELVSILESNRRQDFLYLYGQTTNGDRSDTISELTSSARGNSENMWLIRLKVS